MKRLSAPPQLLWLSIVDVWVQYEKYPPSNMNTSTFPRSVASYRVMQREYWSHTIPPTPSSLNFIPSGFSLICSPLFSNQSPHFLLSPRQLMSPAEQGTVSMTFSGGFLLIHMQTFIACHCVSSGLIYEEIWPSDVYSLSSPWGKSVLRLSFNLEKISGVWINYYFKPH